MREWDGADITDSDGGGGGRVAAAAIVGEKKEGKSVGGGGTNLVACAAREKSEAELVRDLRVRVEPDQLRVIEPGPRKVHECLRHGGREEQGLDAQETVYCERFGR